MNLTSVQHARSLGIETVFQDLALIDTLPVYMNLHLNREPRWGPFLRRSMMRRDARRYLDDIGIDIPSVNAEVAKLSGGQRQAIAVAWSIAGLPTWIVTRVASTRAESSARCCTRSRCRWTASVPRSRR